MNYLLIRHKVADFAKWKAAFDAHQSARTAAGIRTRFLFRNLGNPSELVLIFETNKMEKMRAFVASLELKDAMQRTGVVDKPDVYFLE
jgi:hypothetical protein